MKMMKVAAAAAGLFCAAGSAVAQSAGPTIYGTADAGITRVNNIAGASRTSLDSGIWQSSRIGFRGTEDLGSGRSALFVLEGGFSIDSGAGASAGAFAFNRQSFVGLAGEWGTVTLGRQYDFLYVNVLPVGAEFFAGGLVSGTAGGPGGTAGATNLLDVHFGGARYDNSVKWVKAFGPVTVGLMHGLGQEAPNAADTKSINSALLSYRSGPLAIGLGWTKDDYSAAASGNTANEVIGLKGRYDAGRFTFLANYADARSRNSRATNRPLELAVAYRPLPELNVGLALGRAQATNAAGAGTQMRQVTLGATYNLSRRTALYVMAATNRSGNTAVYRGFVGGPGGAPAPANGASQSVMKVGVTHTF